ncbi:MAG: hypothetical protein U1E15_06275 [Hyphomicrobiales bacterium]
MIPFPAGARRSMIAERETVDRLVAAHLSSKLGATFRPHQRRGGSRHFRNIGEATGADGFVPVSTLGCSFYVLDDVRHALVAQDTGETYQLGDTVDVRLTGVAPVKGGLTFGMASDGKKGAKPARVGRHRVKRPFRGRR